MRIRCVECFNVAARCFWKISLDLFKVIFQKKKRKQHGS